MEELHFASKNQLPGLSLRGTLVEDGLSEWWKIQPFQSLVFLYGSKFDIHS